MDNLEPTAMGLAIAAMLVVFLIIKEIIVPKAKNNKTNQEHYNCLTGLYERRISKLEQCNVNIDKRLDEIGSIIIVNTEKLDSVKEDVSTVKGILEGMRGSGKRNA